MSKRLLIVLIIFAVDVFGAFAWLFYTETPGYVTAEMRRRMAATTAVRLAIDAAGEGTASLPAFAALLSGGKAEESSKAGAFTLHSTTDLDLRDLGEVRRLDSFRATLTSAPSEPVRYDGEARAIGSRRFVEFAELPGTGALATALRGEWAELEAKSFDLPLVRAGVTVDVDAPSAAKLRELFRSARMFTVTKELPEAVLEGARHYRYEAAWKPEAFRTFVVLTTSLREKRSLSDDELERLSATLARTDIRKVELWVRKRDFFLSKVQVQGAYADLDTGEDVQFSVTVSLSRWNEPVDISVPKTSRPIRGFLALSGETGLSLAGGREAVATGTGYSTSTEEDGLPASTSTPFDMNEDLDGDGLTNTLEGFYRTDMMNPDTDGDGYMDGYEVNFGYDPTGPGELFRFGR